MSKLTEKLTKIKFQLKKNLSYSLTDEQLISAVQKGLPFGSPFLKIFRIIYF